MTPFNLAHRVAKSSLTLMKLNNTMAGLGSSMLSAVNKTIRLINIKILTIKKKDVDTCRIFRHPTNASSYEAKLAHIVEFFTTALVLPIPHRKIFCLLKN